MHNEQSIVTPIEAPLSTQQRLWWTAIGYGAMLVIGVGSVYLILRYGATLTAPQAASAAATVATGGGDHGLFLHLLIALIAVIGTGMLLGRLASFLGQPPVIGEVVAGILLGPSLLGTELSGMILPTTVAPYLSMVAQLGVLLYMFTIGLELHSGLLKHRLHSALATSHASIIVPFLLGALLALFLYPRLAAPSVPFTSFALFMGIAMSITAFPVLARILSDRGMAHTELGIIALSCAAIDDVTAWCLLAFVVGIAQSQLGESVTVIGWTFFYLAVMFLLVRPLLRWLMLRWTAPTLSRTAVGITFIALLLSALATEWIGIHAIFGAFLLGVLIPHDSVVARTFSQQLSAIVTVLLLPAFFAFTGMRTRIDLVNGAEQWLLCALIIIVAVAGKLGGSALAARLTGLSWRPALALGALMNTRGLMELIVLNIGLDLGVISPTLFAMMVLMALVTTIMTTPLVDWLLAKPVR